MTLTILLFIFTISVIVFAYNKQNKKFSNRNYILVDVGTMRFDDKDVPLQDEQGKYVIDVIKKDFKLKIPVMINSEDSLIRPPFIECNGKLWVVHAPLQLKDRINLIVLPAGEPTAEKSPFCFDAKDEKHKMTIVK